MSIQVLLGVSITVVLILLAVGIHYEAWSFSSNGLTSIRSAMVCALLLVGLSVAQPVEGSQLTFSAWLEAFAVEARQRGISQSTLDASLADVERIPAVIELDRRQPKEPGDFCGYLDARLTEARIARGRSLLQEHRALLRRVSSEYGVPARFVVALWGLETNFGDYQGEYRVIDALATLAHDERRSISDCLGAGVVRIDGGALPRADMRGKIVMPAAKSTDAFLVYSNFEAILRWNQSIFFGISVGTFADEFSHTASLRACRS